MCIRDSFGTERRSEQRSEPVADRYALVAYRLGNTLSPHGTVSRGVCKVDSVGHLRGVEEIGGIQAVGADPPRARAGERVFSGHEPVSMNLWGLRPTIFPALGSAFEQFLTQGGNGELYLPTVLDRAVVAGAAEVTVLEVEDQWLGVTYREDREPVMLELARRATAYPNPIWG